MRLYYIIGIFTVAMLCGQQSRAQQKQDEKRHLTMIKFLLNQKELTDYSDTIPSNLDVMYDRPILKIKQSAKTVMVYIFGTYSPHGKRFIALIDQTGIKLLESKDLAPDMKVILGFLKRNKVNSSQGYKCLDSITEAYIYNSKRNFRPVPEEK
ncbi:MAG: hypothetical protein AAGC65_07725 [Mucilaginibacter sp.]|uniref:hypothetical protein n=1 Tax=Mucilaginibacter sp. TaxID=1882438 RepID=UPI0031ACC664